MEDNTSEIPYESILSMKHTSSDIIRAAHVLISADETALNELPKHIFYHFYNEISIAFLNWIGRGKNDAIEETLDNLTKLIFNNEDLIPPPDLTIKHRLGMQLRSQCAIMSLYLKVQTSVGYNAMLVGPENEIRKSLLHVLFYLANQKVFNQATFSLQTIYNELRKSKFSNNQIYSVQNIDSILEWLAEQGLVYRERTKLNKIYRLSDRGFIECSVHFVSKVQDSQSKNFPHDKFENNRISSILLETPLDHSFDLGDHAGKANDAYNSRSHNIKSIINNNVISMQATRSTIQKGKSENKFDENYESII